MNVGSSILAWSEQHQSTFGLDMNERKGTLLYYIANKGKHKSKYEDRFLGTEAATLQHCLTTALSPKRTDTSPLFQELFNVRNICTDAAADN